MVHGCAATVKPGDRPHVLCPVAGENMPVQERSEIASFIHTWSNKAKEQVVAELASYSLETKGIPDPYRFLIDQDGDLFSPSARTKVRNSIISETRIGRLEAQAFDAISIWFRENSLGTIAWISPPHPDIYPTSKIIISSIEEKNGRKRLYNRAILFDFNEAECLEIAQNLSEMSKERPLLSHLDEVRATPLILDTDSKSWLYILEELIDDPNLWESIRRGEDKKAKEEALIQARLVHRSLFGATASVTEAKIMLFEMLGDKPSSCPVLFNTARGTAFQIFSENSLVVGGLSQSKDPDFCKNCPVCGEAINCIVRKGEQCPKCPAIRKCV